MSIEKSIDNNQVVLNRLAERLKSLRKKTHLSQEEAVKAMANRGMKISSSLLGYWENGGEKGRNMKVTDLVALSEYYGVSTDYLLGLHSNSNETRGKDLLNELVGPEREFMNFILSDFNFMRVVHSMPIIKEDDKEGDYFNTFFFWKEDYKTFMAKQAGDVFVNACCQYLERSK